MSCEASDVNSRALNELRGKDDRNVGATELDVQVSNNGQQFTYFGRNSGTIDKLERNSIRRFDHSDGIFNDKENLAEFSYGLGEPSSQHFDELSSLKKCNGSDKLDDRRIQVSEDVKKYALQRGFGIYKKMCKDKVPMNEAILTTVARMAMSMGNGDLAFDMVKQMKPLQINPKLRSYGPALSVFCNSGDVDKAFALEKHMLEHGVYPEEPELKALLQVSVEAGEGDKVYYLLHKLRASVRKVSPATAGTIVGWFKSKPASRIGKRKWDGRSIEEAIEHGGGGWHGQGWLGKGKWTVSCTSIGPDGYCKCCGEKLATVDLDPIETENFAESVASIALQRDKDSSFQVFQKWLDYHGPFEAMVDGANVGLKEGRFVPSKINVIVNGIRQKLHSKKWPLIILHNKHISGHKMNEPVTKMLIKKWKTADALYATPTGSNDDWYWLYAAIKFKCLIVTNNEMRGHTFDLLGNDFFARWKERHQVRFNISESAGPVFRMPPPYSVLIQESERGHWHIPIATDHEAEITWLCITRANTYVARKDSITSRPEESRYVDHKNGQGRLTAQTGNKIKPDPLEHGNHENIRKSPQEIYKNLRNILSASLCKDQCTVLSEIEAAEKLGDCVIDFEI